MKWFWMMLDLLEWFGNLDIWTIKRIGTFGLIDMFWKTDLIKWENLEIVWITRVLEGLELIEELDLIN